MNRIHNLLCSSGWWRDRVEQKLVPWGVQGVTLEDRVLEIGPGFGATTRFLDPLELPARLHAAGLIAPEIERRDGSFRFRARKPG